MDKLEIRDSSPVIRALRGHSGLPVTGMLVVGVRGNPQLVPTDVEAASAVSHVVSVLFQPSFGRRNLVRSKRLLILQAGNVRNVDVSA